MPPTKASAFDRQRSAVEAMLSEGEPLALVEEAIEDSRLSAEQKAGLWLLAWSSQPPTSMRENLRATLELVASNGQLVRPGGQP